MATPVERLSPVFRQDEHLRRAETHYLANPTGSFPWIDPCPPGWLPWASESEPSPLKPFGSPPFSSSPLFVDIKPAQRRLVCSVVHDAFIIKYLDTAAGGNFPQFPIMNYDVVACKETLSSYINVQELFPEKVQHYSDNLGINDFIHSELRTAVDEAKMFGVVLDHPSEYTKVASHWMAVDEVFNTLFTVWKIPQYIAYKTRVCKMRDAIRNSDVTLEVPPRKLSF